MQKQFDFLNQSDESNLDLPPEKLLILDTETTGLDSENDQGVVMSSIEYTKNYLLDRLSKDERFDDQERCEALFGLSYGDGNGISQEEFNLFMDGLCVGRDYSAIIDMIESTEEEILENQDT